ncbi:DEAD box helicase, putative [Plasmodium vinckei vinckei]|uniref:DEAD box helicase, putative n=1 Tax=Plasmodium vinckei vinckei TaxID=54757 RepID=A0A449BYE6_PLAVN|nr:DEAD box helicase, putative [Plasmodium vinckei vinckei]VEV58486.1 DEAD box helicase, putative [Plasmodium vinckei vinckei]
MKMGNTFRDEIKMIFPFAPYEAQLEFMKIMYEILKGSNININERIKIVFDIINKNVNMIKDLKNTNKAILNIFNEHSENKTDEIYFTKQDICTEQHIISEMKTGSGKSLTLLSSIIYFLLKHRFDLFLMKENVELKREEPEWIQENIINNIIQKYQNNINMEKTKNENNLKIINKYFTFTNDKIQFNDHVLLQKKKNQNDFSLQKGENNDDVLLTWNDEDVEPDFSLDDGRKKQVPKIRYFSELKKIEKKLSKENLSINMIIIGSRKHLCINEKIMRKCPNVNELNEACRSSKCKYKEGFTEMVLEKKKKKEKKKIFFESSSDSNSDSSKEDNDEINNYILIKKLINTKNIDMNQIKEICKHDKIEICPYYMCKENIQNADIILLPYICILNEQIRNNLKINIKNNIIIFDESQSIIENINNANSIGISKNQIIFTKLTLKKYIQKFENTLNNNNIVMIKQIIIYCDLLLKYFTSINEPVSNITRFMLLSKLDALNLNNISSFLNNSLFCRRFKVFAEININEYFKKTNTERPSIITTNLNSSSIYLLCEFTNKLIRSNKYDYVYINQNDDSGLDNNTDLEDDHQCDNQAGKTNEIKNANNNSNTTTLNPAYPNKRHGYSTYINVEAEKKRKINETNTHQEDNTNKEDHNVAHFSELSEYINYVLENNDITLKEKIEIISVSSCNNFQSITKDCNNVILIGGTLQPIEEFLLLFLNEKKNKIKLYSSDYIFKKENIFVRIMPTNILTFNSIDNTYKNRFDKAHLLNIALQIYILTLYVNYGNIVFFSSYTFLNEFMNFLYNEGKYVLEKMQKKKFLFFEKKNDNNVLKNYMSNIANIKKQDHQMRIKNGCILFCVMNAKLSEGINFYDDFCRNILIVGIPFFKHEKNNTTPKPALNKNALVLNYYKEYSKDTSKTNDSNSHDSSDAIPILSDFQINQMCKTYKLKYAMKIVNQCIGRSMRHINDFSSFFFLDQRFSNSEIYECFPTFVKTHLNSIKNLAYIDNENFQKEKQNFYEIYDDIKNNYKHIITNHQTVKDSQDCLKNFVTDLMHLKEFHKKMNYL